ncbi:MAG: transposase [Sulfuricella sp.]|nr:transposase [Sulfuricella sp.]
MVKCHMPEYRRANTQGGTYFFTVNTHRRQPLLTDEAVRTALREGIAQTRAAYPFRVLAWVLLPDHLHCIWTLPEGDADFAKRWGMIKRHVSRQCGNQLNREEWLSASRRKRGESSLWQRRYWEHQIRDEADLQRHVDYIHWNPIKHGLVQKVADWPYSTFYQYVARGIYSQEWCGDFGGGESDDRFGE